MTRHLLLLAFVLAAGVPTAMAAEEAEVKLASDGTALWRVRYDPTANVSVIALRSETRWIYAQASPGRAVAVTAAGGSLHVFYQTGKYTRFVATRTRDDIVVVSGKPGDRWPREYAGRKVLAATSAIDAKRNVSLYLLLGPAEADTATPPATGPATRAGEATTQPNAGGDPPPADRPIVLVKRKGKWALGAELVADDLDPLGAYHVAVGPDSQLYTLICTADGWPVKFLRYDDERWELLTDAVDAEADRRVRWLLTAGPDLLMAGTGATGAWFRRVDLPGGTLAEPVPITVDGKPVMPTRGESAGLSTLGATLAMIWPEKDAWQFGTVDLKTGAVSSVEPIALGSANGDEIQPWIRNVYLVLGLTLFGVLLYQIRSGVIGPFTLPARFVPAPWFKRIIAFLFDQIPAVVIASAVLGLSAEELSRMGQEFQDTQIVSEQMLELSVLNLGIYLLYAIIAEWRFGATGAKWALRMRVIARDGGRLSLPAAVLRNLTKPFELLRPMVIVFMLWPIFARYHQRFGDMLAGSVVVDRIERPVSEGPPPIPDQPRDSSDTPDD